MSRQDGTAGAQTAQTAEHLHILTTNQSGGSLEIKSGGNGNVTHLIEASCITLNL